jgi:hypothetical protein
MPIQQTRFTLKCDICMNEETLAPQLRTVEEVKGRGRDKGWLFLFNSKTKSDLCFCDYCVGRVLRNAYEAEQERQKQYRDKVDENRAQNREEGDRSTPTVGASHDTGDRTSLGNTFGKRVK